jgi:hypothetical protein
MDRGSQTQEWWLNAKLLAAVDGPLRSFGPETGRRVKGLIQAKEYHAALQAIVTLLHESGGPVTRGLFDYLTELAEDVHLGPDSTEPLRGLVVEGPVASDTTAALRERSITRLQEGFRRHVADTSAQKSWDPRDEMLDLTPYLDCARRLGYDPAIELGPIARTGAPWLTKTFTEFVRRKDVTLVAFGWSVIDTPDGPAYRFAWPKWEPPKGRA